MPLDHYVSQVHLKQLFSPALGSRLYATKKSDLKSFQCHSKDVCRIEDGSTNAHLINDRAIEEFLRGVEPNYDAAISKVRQGAIDQECVAVVAGFAAYVACCAPAAMRIHPGPLIGVLESTANILDRQGLIEKAPPSLGSKFLSELLADGTVRHTVDEKYPQALGISTIMGRMSIWGNSAWEILHNDIADNPFFTSDYPVALEAKGNRGLANWIVPLAPDLAIRIVPDTDLSGTVPELSFRKFRHRQRALRHAEVLDINRLIVRCAEDMVFYRDDLPWVLNFVEKNRYYRIETVTERIPHGTGFVVISTQQIVSRKPRAETRPEQQGYESRLTRSEARQSGSQPANFLRTFMLFLSLALRTRLRARWRTMAIFLAPWPLRTHGKELRLISLFGMRSASRKT